MRAGMSADEARRRALVQLGGVAQTRQTHREQQGLPWIEILAQDVRFGWRMLRKSPGFTVVAVATLALGIGANTALFSIVDGVLLHSLPFTRPGELVAVHQSKPNFEEGSISWPNFLDWKRENRTLAALAVERQTNFTLTGAGRPEQLFGDYVSADFFSLLGIKSVAGRLFAHDEDEPGRAPVALISAGLWKRKFGEDRGVIGKAMTLDWRRFTIIGVVPGEFGLALSNFRKGDVYVPVAQWQTKALTDRGAGLGLHGIGRLKPGVTVSQAQADMNLISDHLAAAFPEYDRGQGAKLLPLRESMVGGVQPLLLVLLGAVAFLLLIACGNLANLLLARSNARTQEIAMRLAVGAGRARIIRQLLTECVLLAVVGGGLGLLLAGLGTPAMLKLAPNAVPRASSVHMSLPVFGFAAIVSLLVGVLCGLLPARNAARQDLQSTLKEGGRGGSGTRNRSQDALIVFEMALTLILLTGAGLEIRSLRALAHVNPGFQAKGILTFSVSTPYSPRTATPSAAQAYMRELTRQIGRVPGIEAVSPSWGGLPLSGDSEELFWMDSEARPADTNGMHMALSYVVGPGYLKVMGTRLMRGRFFTDRDREQTPLVAVIDEVFARRYFGERDAVGRRLNLSGVSDERRVTIVGVARHVMQWGLDNDDRHSLRAEIYLPVGQLPVSQLISSTGINIDVVVRAADPAKAITDIGASLRQMDGNQVMYGAETMEEIVAKSLAARRFSMVLLGLFAGLGLVLSTVGLYGVISYVVSQRTREMAIRMALGADREQVRRWVMRRGGSLAAVGAAVGLVGALGLGRVMANSTMLYGVPSYDPGTLCGVIVLLLAVALAACYVPARRASSVDPIVALRVE